MASHGGRLAVGEELVGDGLDGHGGGALTHSDENRPVPDHVDVPSLDGCGLVRTRSSPP